MPIQSKSFMSRENTMPYRVFCKEHHYSEKCKLMREALYLENQHHKKFKCLEATHERIAG